MWLNKNFISGQVLNASDLNSIVKGLNDIEYKIPNTSINNIREEQDKLNGTILNVKNTITNILNTIGLYNIEELKNGISLLNSSFAQYEKDLNQAKTDIATHNVTYNTFKTDVENKLKTANELINNNKEKIQESVSKLKDAEDALNLAEETLRELFGSGEAGVSILEALARIDEFATWYDENKEFINDYQGVVDMVNGVKNELLTSINTNTDTITTLGEKYDLHDASITTFGEQISTNTGNITSVETRLSAAEGRIELNAEEIESVSGYVDIASMTIDSLLNDINILTSRTDTAEGKIDNAEVNINALQDAITLHTESINTNTSSITEAKTILSGIDASITNKVSAAVDGEFSSIENRLSAAEGTIELHSTFITNDFESNVADIVDTKTADIKTKVSTIDALNGRVTSAETWIKGTGASISNKVKDIDTVANRVTAVEQELDGEDGKFSVLASRVSNNETFISNINLDINSIKSQVLTGNGTYSNPYKISSAAINADQIVSTVLSAISEDIDKAKSDASDALYIADQTSASVSTQSTTIQLLSKSVTMIANAGKESNGVWTPTVNPATIVAAITEDDNKTLKSDIMLNADTITLVGNTVVENLNAMDLTVGGGSTVFNKDGSGHTANGNISWTEDGFTNQMYMSNVNGLRISLPGFNSPIYESEDEDDYIITCENITFSTTSGYVEGICIVLKAEENIKVVFIDKYGKRTVFKIGISIFAEDYEEDSEIFGKISNHTIYLFFRNEYDSEYDMSVGYLELSYFRNYSGESSIQCASGRPLFRFNGSYPLNSKNIPAIIEYEGFVYFIQQTSSSVQIIKTDNNNAYVYLKSFVIDSNIKMMSDNIGIIGGNTIVVPVLNSSNRLSLYWLGLYNLQNLNFTLSEWDYAPEISGSTSNTFFINGDALIHPSDEGCIAMICCLNKCYPIIEKVSVYGPLVANWTALNQNNYMFTENSFSNMSFKNQIEYLLSSDYTFLNSDPFLYSRKDTKMHKGNNTVKGLFLNSDGQPMAYTEEDVLVCDGDLIDLIDLICSKLM